MGKKADTTTIWIEPKKDSITQVVRPKKTLKFNGPPPYEIEEKDFPLISDLFNKTTRPKEKKEVTNG
jgi:hypothetical protein